MGKITPNKPIVPHAPTTRTEKSAELSGPLKKLRETTNRFVVLGRGHGMLGAGKPPSISNTPPQKSSKRVAQSVVGSLMPARRIKT